MGVEFYNELFKVLLISMVTYIVSYVFLFLLMVDQVAFSKGEKLFLALTPLLVTIIVLILYGIKITGGF